METNQENNSSTKSERLSVFRPVEPADGEKKPWPRVGVAFRNRDGSLNLILNVAVEANTRLQVRAVRQGERA